MGMTLILRGAGPLGEWPDSPGGRSQGWRWEAHVLQQAGNIERSRPVMPFTVLKLLHLIIANTL